MLFYYGDEFFINYVEVIIKNGEVGYNKNCEKIRIIDLYFVNDFLFLLMGVFNLNNFEIIIWMKECVGVFVVFKNKWIWVKKKIIVVNWLWRCIC